MSKYGSSRPAGIAGPTMAIPAWLWGGNPRGMADACQWSVVANADGTWSVRSRERVNGSAPKLVSLHALASAKNYRTAGAYAWLKQLKSDLQPSKLAPETKQVAALRKQTLLDNVEPGLFRSVNLAQASLMVEDLDSLVPSLREFLSEMLTSLPGASVAILRQDQALSYRVAASRVFLMLDEDPSLLHDVTSVDATRGFASARHLYSSYQFGLDAYLAPAMLALSPFAFGFTVNRVSAVLVFNFGTAIRGIDPHLQNLVSMFAPSRSKGRIEVDLSSLPPAAFREALSWWVAHLNRLFGCITDPSNFVSPSGAYDARSAFATLLSVEQLFANVQAQLVNVNDSHSRRQLCFDALDTLEGLRLFSFEHMCSLKVATESLDNLERILPPYVASVLLPRARAAVTALKNLQGGFFAKSRLTTNGIVLPSKHGDVEYSLEKASAMYLRVLRNAGHGFAGKHDDGRRRDEALLASHTGEVGYGLADLAYLYLLRLIASPDLLRRPRPRS